MPSLFMCWMASDKSYRLLKFAGGMKPVATKIMGCFVVDIVCTYKHKTTRQSWDETAMNNAIQAVKKREMGIKKTSATFNVPKTTLRRRARNKNKHVSDGTKGWGGQEPLLCTEIETDLVQYIIKMEEMFLP